MVGWFLVPVVLGSVGYYVVRPNLGLEPPQTEDSKTQEEGSETISKKFATPKVTVTAQRAEIRRRGSVIGKRPRARKKVETPKVEEAPTGGTMGPEPTSTGGGETVAPIVNGGPPTGTGAG